MRFSNVIHVKKIKNNFLEPPQQQLANLLEHYKAGRYIDAEKLSLSITKEFPKHQFAWKVLGALLKQNGRIDESLVVSKKSLQLNPQDAEAHNNLGVLLQDKEKLKEAETSFRKAIKLKPNYAEAYSNLGSTLQKQERLKEAETNFRKAITLKSDYAEAYSNLGNTLKKQDRFEEAGTNYAKAIKLKPNFIKAYVNLGILHNDLGKFGEACSAFIQAINLNPNFNDAYANLGMAIKNVRFNSSNIKLYPFLIHLLKKENFVRPRDLAPSILSLIKHDPAIKNLLIRKNFSKSLKEINSIINSLDKLRLLHDLMRVCPLPDLQFEEFFVALRGSILANLDYIEGSPQFIYFLSTLSLHCFTNEYVYVEKNIETEMIQNLENEIIKTVEKSEQPETKKILCLASYRQLHQYKWCQKIESLNNLEEVNSRLIQEPCLERNLATKIPVLGEISDDISRKVRLQYEQNPYPRWVKTKIPSKSKTISEFCKEVNIHLFSESIKKVVAPAILIAGCGTGQHSIGIASEFSDCEVTAVDLSLASLAYAKRKTTELEIANLKYLQADILGLGQLKQKFDIIESVGVLHHMDKPLIGWRLLTDLLKPGGLIKIGLYSELAREHIVGIRKEITSLRVGTSESEIREFRRLLTESKDENHQQLAKSSDFFSLSTFRDLVFHVQEHRFTLLQIQNYLKDLKLKFCGFVNKEAVSNFKKFHKQNEDIYDLTLWHQYEKNNPRAFAAMYQFWCQKI